MKNYFLIGIAILIGIVTGPGRQNSIAQAKAPAQPVPAHARIAQPARSVTLLYPDKITGLNISIRGGSHYKMADGSTLIRNIQHFDVLCKDGSSVHATGATVRYRVTSHGDTRIDIGF